MSIVRYAAVCDKCGKRGEEYGSLPDCFECIEEFCPACGFITVEADVDQRERGYCFKCVEVLRKERDRIDGIMSAYVKDLGRRVSAELARIKAK